MVTDLRRCVACHACTAASNGEWDVPPGHARTHVRPTPASWKLPKLVKSVYVAQCNHCDRPSCVPACPTGATYQAPDGCAHRDAARAAAASAAAPGEKGPEDAPPPAAGKA